MTFNTNIGSSPFGYPSPVPPAPGTPPRPLLEMQTFARYYDLYAISDVDQQALPSNTAWKWDLPTDPAHGRFRNALYFDNRVEARKILARGKM